MEQGVSILAITGPIYVIIALGYLCARSRLFSAADMRVLGRYVINISVPALLFRAFSQHRVTGLGNGLYLVGYATASLVLLLGVTWLVRSVLRKPMPRAALQGLGVSNANSAFIGYPIALHVAGPAAGLALALCMIVENLVIMPLALAMAERGGERSGGASAMLQWMRAFARNPMLMAIVAGFAFALTGIAMPDVAAHTLEIVATAASPVALFVIGGSLIGLRLEGQHVEVAFVAFGKLVLHPLAVLAAFALLPPIDPALRAAAVVIACSPMLSIYPVLAQKHHLEGFCAAALLVTTLASFVTISALLWAMRHYPGWLL